MRSQNRFKLFRIFVDLTVAALMVTASAIAIARDIPITIEGCPNQLSLHVPDDFFTAATLEQRAHRSAVIDRLHTNPGRKARYSEVLFIDWNDDSGFPQILVASLGSTRQSQGRLSETQWQELKRMVLTSSKLQQEAWMRQGLSRLRPGMPHDVQQVQGRILRLGDGGPNDLTIFGESQSTVTGKSFRIYTAAKFNYAKQCLAYVTVSVKASDENALVKLVQFAEQISVR